MLFLAAIALLATACGVKTAYNNADWLLVRWVNDRVSLNESQERAVRASIEEHLAWHCANELPEYAAFLRQVDRDVAAGRITPATIESYGDRVSVFGRRLLVEVRPSLVDLLASLDDKQVSELMESFEERNRELLEEAKTYADEEAARERAEDFEKGMRRFAGRLTDRQRDRLLQWADDLEPTAEMALQERLAWQAEFLRVMSLRDDRETFETAIIELLQPGRFASETHERQRRQNRERTFRTVAEIHAMAPKRQIEELRDNLADFSRDLEQLSCS